jgi:hypothetical protein
MQVSVLRLSVAVCLLPVAAAFVSKGQDVSPPEPADRPPEAIEKLRSIKERLGLDEDIAAPIIEAEAEASEHYLELLRTAERKLVVDAELKEALRPMGRRCFREARDRLRDYLRAGAGHRVAAFALSLCEIELGDYRAAYAVLVQAFPKDEEYPAVQLLKAFSGRLAEHDSQPVSTRQVCEAFVRAHSTVRRAAIERPATFFFSALVGPFISDIVLFRFLMLSERADSPLSLSGQRLLAAAEKMDSPWASLALAALLGPDVLQDELNSCDDDGPPPCQILAILSQWYGKDSRYKKDSRARLAAIRKLQALDPENGAWRLLEIPFDTTIAEEDDYRAWYKPFARKERRSFLKAFEHKTLRFECAELDQAALEMISATQFPYAHLLESGFTANYNTYPHLSNVINRAQSTARRAIKDGDRELAVRVARCLLQLSEHIRSQNVWAAWQSELTAGTYATLGCELLAKAYEDDPDQYAVKLRELAETELFSAAAQQSEMGTSPRQALPLAMLDAAVRAENTKAGRMARAVAWLRSDPELADRLHFRFSDSDFAQGRFVSQVVIAEARDIVPTLIEHVDSYDFDVSWRVIWAFGKLRDERAREKLLELDSAEDATLRAMARWSLSQLDKG